MGSRSNSKSNTEVSDIDILIVLKNNSIKSRKRCLQYLRDVHAGLSEYYENEVFDIFLMSDNIANLHFLTMPVLAGRAANKSDLLFGKHDLHNTSLLLPDYFRKNIYRARLSYLLHECLSKLPAADTADARKAAKLLLRTLKVAICALSADAETAQHENQLVAADGFDKAEDLFFKLTGKRLNTALTQKVLNGENIDDWSLWMIEQNQLLSSLYAIEDRTVLCGREFFFYDSIGKVLQDLLCLDLKDIIGALNPNDVDDKSERYINRSASLIVKLALAGVDSLGDFEAANAPSSVLKSYDLTHKHLSGEKIDNNEGVAASMILLEYALTQCLDHINLQQKM